MVKIKIRVEQKCVKLSHRYVRLYVMLVPYVHGLYKKFLTKGREKETNQPMMLQSEALLELTVWNSQQLSQHVSFYLLHA